MSIHRFYEYRAPNTGKKLTEFLVSKIYTCEVVVTNVSTSQQSFQLLWQIPSGAVPLLSTPYQKTEAKSLSQYTTLTTHFHFYFPKTGEFTQFPSNLAIGNKVVAVAQTCNLKVVDKLTQITFEAFSDYIHAGDLDKIYEFLATKNLVNGEMGFKFPEILYLLKDKDVYTKIIEILRNRMIFEKDVWSYAFYHQDKQGIKEFLRCGVYTSGPNGDYVQYNLINPTGEEDKFRHLDYYPLINARAHQMTDDVNKSILNKQFRATYNRFLFKAAHKKELSTEDKMNWSLYYLLQDRVNESIEMFKTIDETSFTDRSSMKVQYDYMASYLDFFTGQESNFSRAREISGRYLDYPIKYWRDLFLEVHEQLQEFDGSLELGDQIDQTDEDKRRENMKKSKELAPVLECRLNKKEIEIDYINIEKVDIKYYVVDPELMFSKSPFISQNSDDFSYIMPQAKDTHVLDPNLKFLSVPIDEQFVTKNLVIEIIGGSTQSFLSYYSSELKVVFNEKFGELKVTDSKGKSLSSVYVKVYAKHTDGSIKFFRDGYTDIRGKLEYAQSSSGKLDSINKFSVFIMSDELGSLIKECHPPSNVKK